MLLALVAGLPLSRRRRRIRDIVLLLRTIPAVLYSLRHIPIAVLVLTPALAGLAEARLSGRGHVRSFQKGQIEVTTRTALLNALVLVTSLSFTVAWVRHIARQQGQIEAEKFPFAASAFLNRERPQGPILNHYNWGGYFIWKLYPQ